MRALIILSWASYALMACHELRIDEQCFPHLLECADSDFDGDGVSNKDDPFPLNDSCTEATETLCDGVDNDCDGAVDETYEEVSSTNQRGVCVGSVKVCVEGAYAEPDQSFIDGYEAEELSCDGEDNDCDGEIDESLDPPSADVQTGICTGTAKVCDGAEGWIEPDYASVDGYTLEAEEHELMV